MALFKKYPFVLFLLLTEGAALMAVELLSAKLLAPFFGNSLYVWTMVLNMTVLGLTGGYYAGGWLAKKPTSEKSLVIILSIAALLVFLLPFTASVAISLSKSTGLFSGIFLSTFLLLIPPTLLFGLIGPLTVRLLAQDPAKVGLTAGSVYFTSTVGGIVATFLFGFYLIPVEGLRFSSMVAAAALALIPALFVIKTYVFYKNTPGFSAGDPNSAAIADSVNPTLTQVRSLKSKPANQPPKQTKVSRSIYLFAMIEGATVMAVQLLSSRMLAPWFGSSLYVWGSVIGITLLGLASGYYAGGWLADRKNNSNNIHWVMLAAAAAIVMMHHTSATLTRAMTHLDLVPAVVLISLFLILPVMLLLGMVPTLIIRQLSARVDDAGPYTGKVFAISSLSGIVALPIFGFLIIPVFGLTIPSVILGLAVGIVPMWKLVAQKKYISLAFLAAVLISFSGTQSVARIQDVQVRYYSEGLLGQVLVADLYKNEKGEPVNQRGLFVNRFTQTYIDNTNQVSGMQYITFAGSLVSKLPENSTALVLGLGGGSLVNYLYNNLQIKVDAVELDQRIAMVARNYFALNPAVNVVVDDARHYLETTSNRYDLIFFDVFKGEAPPAHVHAAESFLRAKALLNPGGMILVNFNGFLTGEIGRPGRSIYATLEAAGLQVKILPLPGEESDRNTLFVGTKEHTSFKTLRSPLLFRGTAVDMDSLFADIKTLQMTDAVVLTDDKPELERLNIPAGNIWRQSANSGFNSFFTEKGISLFN